MTNRSEHSKGTASQSEFSDCICCRPIGTIPSRPDSPKMAEWYRQAAERGDADAQYNYALCCAVGNGIPQNSAQAAHWFRKAAEQGNTEAQKFLEAFSANPNF